jgi:hypothetical protein
VLLGNCTRLIIVGILVVLVTRLIVADCSIVDYSVADYSTVLSLGFLFNNKARVNNKANNRLG